MNALFNGAIYFARIEFTIRDQNNKVLAISSTDMNTMISYAQQAALPIMQYASQYGRCRIAIGKRVLKYAVTLPSASFDDNQLKSWIKDMFRANNLSANDCIVVPKHDSLANTSWGPGTGGEHYFDGCAYILTSVAGTFDKNGDLSRDGLRLAVRDTNWQFAGNLSHEIAEMTVDPQVNGNPEVCDPCGPNCVSTYLNYFDAAGNYITTTQDPPYIVTKKNSFDFSFYINGIVTPAHSGDCPAPAAACAYAPPLQWMPLYGSGLRQIVCEANRDGRLEVFAIGGDNAVYHTWQQSPNAKWFDWSSWTSLGGKDIRQIAIARNADGRLELFALGGDKAAYHIWQTAPNGGWGQWAGLGGHDLRQLAVGKNADGRLELFALGGDKALYHIWQTAPNAGWGQWAGLGGHDLLQIAIAANSDGRLEAFAIGGNRAAYHIWQTAPNGGWGPWANLGGHDLQQIATGKNADGRLELFALGGDKKIYHTWQIQPNGVWGNWASLAGHDLQQLMVCSNADKRLELFAVGGNNAVYHIWQTQPNGNWGNWSGLGGDSIAGITAGKNADGRLELFGIAGPNNTLVHLWQVLPNGGWN